jgi:predicted Zn-dependent protease
MTAPTTASAEPTASSGESAASLGESAVHQWFEDLADATFARLETGEQLHLSFGGEDTDFVRFNGGSIRQAGSIRQRQVELDLIEGLRHTRASVELSGDLATDAAQVADIVAMLRSQRAAVPEDPYLLLPEGASTSHHVADATLPDPDEIVGRITSAGSGIDAAMVGVYAAGRTRAGFAGSAGQRHWYSAASFDLDWSFHLHADVSSKHRQAGVAWDDDAFATAVASARTQLDVLARPAVTLEPGAYRTLLAPAAVAELIDLLSWGGFGIQARQTRETPLLHLIDGTDSFSPMVSFTEDTAGGVAPPFNEDGFVRPAAVPLVVEGRAGDALVSPRSAQEFGVPTNGASSWEAPESFAMAPGTLAAADALAALGTGLSVGNLWYTNYSDRSACRITGMTRFATFWVEDGELVAPVSVLRFDDTLYRLFGDRLEALTDRAELILDQSTYEHRSTGSLRVPGALVSEMTYTL